MSLLILGFLCFINALGILWTFHRWHLIAKEARFLEVSVERLTPQILNDFFKYIESVRPLLKFSYEWLALFKQRIIQLNSNSDHTHAIYRSMETFPQIFARSQIKQRLANISIGFVLINVFAVGLAAIGHHLQLMTSITTMDLSTTSLYLGTFSVTHLVSMVLTTHRLKAAFMPCFVRLAHFCPLFDTSISQVASLELIKVQTDYLAKIAAGIANSNAILQAMNEKLPNTPANDRHNSYMPTIHESVLDIAKLQERPRPHMERKESRPAIGASQSIGLDSRFVKPPPCQGGL
jgi:hypothetical protein